MGNTVGCASTHAVETRKRREEEDETITPTRPFPTTENNDHYYHFQSTSLDNNDRDSTIVNIPKGKSLRYVSLERTLKDTIDSQHLILKAISQNNMNDVIGYNTQQVLDREYLICVYPNLDKNILVYMLTDGMDKIYYHIRDIDSIIRDKNSLYGESSESVHYYILYLNSIQHCIRTMDLFFEPQERDLILLSKRLLLDPSSNSTQVTITIPLYPLNYNVDINIRDVFMLVTKYSRSILLKHQNSVGVKPHPIETKRQESLTLLTNEFKKQSSTKSINDERAHVAKDSSNRASLDFVNIMSSPGSLHSSPASSPRGVSSLHSQISELVNALRNHQNEEVRSLITRLESLLTENSNRTSSDSLAEVLVSKASVHSMNVRESVKDMIVTDDQETRKWLSDEVLKGTTLMEDSSDYSWKKKVKAFTKAIVFTNRLREMGSAASRKSAISVSLDLTAINAQKEDFIELPFDISEYLKEHAQSYFNFDVFKFEKLANGEPLYYLCLYFFQMYDLANNLNIPVKIIKSFLKEVESKYKKNPYHNNCHATDVVQSAFSLYHCLFAEKSVVMDGIVPTPPSSTPLDESSKPPNSSLNPHESSPTLPNSSLNPLYFHLNPLDILALLVACLAHDVCHPGVTNLFEKKTRTERAIMFNDRSILENFHCYNLFKILSKEEFNLFVNMNNHQYEYLRELIVEMILATDISQHFLIVGQMKSNDIFNHEKFSIERKECLLALLKVLIKCADVSNPTKRFPVYGEWVDRIMNEFYHQGDRERELHLDISPFMDRNNQNVPKCQTGFMEFIVMPLFSLLFDFKPQDSKPIREQTEFNYKSMQDMCKNGQMMKLEEILQVMKKPPSPIHESKEILSFNTSHSPRPSSQPLSSSRTRSQSNHELVSPRSGRRRKEDDHSSSQPTLVKETNNATTMMMMNTTPSLTTTTTTTLPTVMEPLLNNSNSSETTSPSGLRVATKNNTNDGLSPGSTTNVTSISTRSSKFSEVSTRDSSRAEEEEDPPLVVQSVQEDDSLPQVEEDSIKRSLEVHRENLVDDDGHVLLSTTSPNEEEEACIESLEEDHPCE